ncbi:MAG: response regulator [Acidobacteria bacterium]|nr:response regulator [Acidobacteriota bacterium]
MPRTKSRRNQKVEKTTFKVTEDTLADYSLLLVDDGLDDGILRAMWEDFLYGVKRLELVTDAFAAFEKTRYWTPDLAIVDVNLPGMSGFGLIEKWKEQSRSIKVMIMTGYALELDNALYAGQLGACDYIQKPYRFDDELTMRIKKAIVFGSPITPVPLIYNDNFYIEKLREKLNEVKDLLSEDEVRKAKIVENELTKPQPDHGLIKSIMKAGGKLTTDVLTKLSEDLVLKMFS